MALPSDAGRLTSVDGRFGWSAHGKLDGNVSQERCSAMHNPLQPGYYGSQELRDFGFQAVGENVLLSRDCTVIGAQNIVLGDNVRIDSGTAIIASGGTFTLEGWNHIGGQCHFCVAADLTMGQFSGTSQGVRIYTASDDYSGRNGSHSRTPSDLSGVRVRSINIARHVGIGSGAVVLPGCHIDEGSFVGALSLVNRPLRAWGIYHGNPVKRIAERSQTIDLLHAALKHRLRSSG